MLRIISSIISLALIIVITVFAINNREIIEVSMAPFAGTYNLPIYGAVLLALLLGFAWGALVVSWSLVKIHFKHKTLHSTLKKHIDY
jgi:uncharacterized integral membrane protein